MTSTSTTSTLWMSTTPPPSDSAVKKLDVADLDNLPSVGLDVGNAESDKKERPRKPPTQAESVRIKHHLQNEDYEASIQHAVKERAQVIRLRWCMSAISVLFTVVWLTAVFVVVILQGLGTLSVETPVLLGLITTTTVNMLGLLAIVFKFVFPLANNTSVRDSSSAQD